MRGSVLLLMLVCTGCGGVMLEGVPTDPIAFVRQQASEGLLGIDDFREAVSVDVYEVGDANRRRPKKTTSIALIVPETRELKIVPDLGAGAFPLDWSADGTRLLIGQRDDRTGGLNLTNWHRFTGRYSRVTPGGSAGLAAAGPGPIRLATVAFLPNIDGGKPASWIRVQVDGRGGMDVPDSEHGETPSVSADGRTVVFARRPRRAGRESMLFLANVGEPKARPVGRGSQPRFSRNGALITFARRGADSQDIWVMRADGTAKRAITRSSYDESWPSLSPKGDFVVYDSVRGSQLDQSQLFLARVADGAEIQLTQSGQNARPVW